jgi:hypothetical protein
MIEKQSIRNKNTDFLMNAKYGIFVHYLNNLQNCASDRGLNQGKVTSWDECVSDFDVNKFVSTVKDIGADYVIFTLMQQTKYMCAPNSTYNFYTGYVPGQACSSRDLINDLYGALNKEHIKLMLYTTGEGPAQDKQAAEGIGWDGKVKLVFQSRWYGCMKEYSDRYGFKVSGWWVDGCYAHWGNADSNLTNYSANLKSGNPNSVVAFNPGVQTIDRYTCADDYTCGEREDLKNPCSNRWVNDCQWHCLTYLGHDWAYPDIKYTNKQLIDYVRSVKANNGAITLDAGVFRDGTISSVQKEQLKALKEEMLKGW